MNEDFIHRLIYSSGDIFLPAKIRDFLSIDLIGSSSKTFYISVWSIVHLLSGILVGSIYKYFKDPLTKDYYLNMLLIHSTWEFWQILIGMSKPFRLSGRSNLMDTIIDTILFMIGSIIALNHKNK